MRRSGGSGREKRIQVKSTENEQRSQGGVKRDRGGVFTVYVTAE